MKKKFENLLSEVRACKVCQDFLPLGSNPLVHTDPDNKVLIIGQAPGLQVHENGMLWKDKSGDNLRNWLGVNEYFFYESKVIGLMPMGFCYPGKGKSGDLPPRPECAPLWHQKIMTLLPKLKLILLVGRYAQEYYLRNPGKNLTETVRSYRSYLPTYLPLPHPSPGNFRWQLKNPWFKKELMSELQKIIRTYR